MNCDVLVVGGGAAGIAAAAAAGRAGARVVLLERYGFLGGLATAAEVGTICGLYLRDSKNTEPTPVAGGFAQEFGSRLIRATGQGPMRLDHGLWVLPFAPSAFAKVADEVVKESGNIILALHATLTEAGVEGGRVSRVRALAWNQPLAIVPGAVVDCSGEATAAASAGAPTENGAMEQAPALVFTLAGVEPGLVQRGLLEVRRALRSAVEAGSLPPPCERLALVPGTGLDGRLAMKLNLVPGDLGVPHWEQVTAWERGARRLVDQLQRFLVETVPAFRNARLASIAPQIGIRSGRRIRGRTTLADADVLGTGKTPFGIARGCWPMERWGQGLRPEMAFFSERGYYEIPLGCLRPVELDNLLAAGRCIAATPGAMTSARVIGTSLAMGWAAGTVAAFQALGRPADQAVETIRKQLEER